ncbi:lipoprotein [Dehalogenimonas sp. WBC-2]|nr:lipoprotein [Dehalogenimonas sp. WBC-2]
MKWNKVMAGTVPALIVTAGLLSGCAEVEADPSPTDVSNNISVDEIMASLVTAAAGIKTYEVTYDMTATLSGGGMDGQHMVTTYAMTIDAPGKKLFMDITSETSHGNLQGRTFMIDGIIYTKVDRSDLGNESGVWEKLVLSAEQRDQVWYSYNTSGQIPVLTEGAAVELQGTETVNGNQAYKIKVTPSTEKILEYLGGSAEEVADMMADPNQPKPEQVQVTIWVNTENYLPARMDTSLVFVSGDMSQTQVTSITYTSINQPVSITLPDEALAAIDVTDSIPDPANPPPPTEPNMDELQAELHNVKVAVTVALIEGNGTVVAYDNEIIPVGGKTGGVNDPGMYLVRDTKFAYTITADGTVYAGIPVP